ncbi:hypothetical protein [Gordonia hankookensis]|uniref:Response regulatory domain-containing protein n=1 Tax=Gordonia hankookensis TaxID=589403 RepID=A0ABR7WGS3_9ACTN|nr:hypothetical protein [Gordonia hankookensis]MBD1321077.1 hypothetical protein [Gordonia hankookensis]NDZ96650.1 hypothetical protein [Streptomyces sp. SID11726]NEB23332.1 hypothetical protein [Streptomyces sp. SID6673]
MRKNTHTPTVPLIVLDDDPAVLDYARALFRRDIPLGVVSSQYSAAVPFMLGNNGHTAALVADVDDPDQLAEAIVLVERRLGRVTSVIRYATDLPESTDLRATASAA